MGYVRLFQISYLIGSVLKVIDIALYFYVYML
jgi:hypothetical protein